MNDIEKYLNNLNEEQKKEIKRLLMVSIRTIPDANECITYGMPGFKYKGKYFIAFAAAKNHYGIYPGAGVIAHLTLDLKEFDTSKGTIRYNLENPISDSILKKILLQRKADIDSE